MSDRKEKFCNMCSMSLFLDTKDFDLNCGLVDAKVIGQYHSPTNGALHDLETYTFSLCEFCLNHLFQKFVIPPDVQMHCPEAKGSFIPKEVQLENDFKHHGSSKYYKVFTEKENICSSKRK